VRVRKRIRQRRLMTEPERTRVRVLERVERREGP